MILAKTSLLLVLSCAIAAAQEVQLPDGNVITAGASSKTDLQKLPPPPAPPALGGAQAGAQSSGPAASGQVAASDDDTVQRAIAAMKLMGADPAKDRDLFEKLVATIRQNRKPVDAGTAGTQAGSQVQDASAQGGAQTNATGAAPVQPVAPADGQAVAGQAVIASGGSSCCAPVVQTCVPTTVVYTTPCYVTYPRVYVERCYPVIRPYPVTFRGFVGFGGGGGHVYRMR